MTDDKKNVLLTRREAAEYLGVKYDTLSLWATKKRYNLPMIKIGRMCKYRKEDLDNFIENRLVKENDQP